MTTPTLSLIVAIADNNVIGIGNRLPWHIPADLGYFRTTTRGKPCIMGRKTFESIVAQRGSPLPDRPNIVLTRDTTWQAAGAQVVHTLADGIALAGDAPEVMILGGSEIYAMALPLVHKLYITRVHIRPKGDAKFPAYDETQWRRESSTPHPETRDIPAFTFEVYSRIG
ncbi:MAG: dihydrofolate reductase [Alphaproteobacteria bacterium]